jgi:hypothetical protein
MLPVAEKSRIYPAFFIWDSQRMAPASRFLIALPKDADSGKIPPCLT